MLTPEQIAQYHDDGYVLASGLFVEQDLVEMEDAFDGIVRRRMRSHTELKSWGGSWKDDLPEMSLLHTHDLQAYSARWTRVLTHERLAGAFADLLGGNVQYHHSKLFQKPPENGAAFPMHQDFPYFPHDHHTMMAGIIHLTDATEQMGCVRVVPASHKLGPLPLYDDPSGAGNKYLDPQQYPIEDATPCPARRGDVLFFSYLTIHGSGINASDRVRKTVLIQVRDPSDRPTEDTHFSP
ncbi:MAG: phytanoyl-CoA dioxygenase [Phycisphaeraceae bacterium]|nr:phytanoyl-CoA dioxygenase [Phycisphaeraceae bacterium]